MFDLDPFDLALGLSLGEQIAEEERIQSLLQQSNEDIFDTDDPYSQDKIKRTHPRKRSKVPLKGFEKYVQDIIDGKRDVGEKYTTGFDIHDVEDISSLLDNHAHQEKQIKIVNGAIVSERYLELVQQFLDVYPHHNVERIYFHIDGTPIVNELPVFSTYDARDKTIAHNLKKHFDHAFILTFKAQRNLSIRILLWHTMLSCTLHEIFHSFEENFDPDLSRRDQLEERACQWEKDELIKIANSLNIEPPKFESEKYFCNKYKLLAQQLLKQGESEWIEHQKLLLDANVMYWAPQSHVAIQTAKEFYGIVPPERQGGGINPKINKHLKAEDKNTKAFIENEQLKEQAFKEAISMGYKVKIFLPRKQEWLTIHPVTILYEGGSTYLRCSHEEEREKFNINFIAIDNISFVPN